MPFDSQPPDTNFNPPTGKRFANQAERQLLKVAEMSVTDSMTGLPNRRAFDISLTQLQNHPGPVTILYLDLDKLKPINDTYGHLAGDKILKSMAKINFPLPVGHKLYRIGGDEFAFIVPEDKNPNQPSTNSETELIEQVKVAITEYNQSLPVDDFPISISIGGATSTDKGHHNLWDVVKKADAQMYLNKNNKDKQHLHDFGKFPQPDSIGE